MWLMSSQRVAGAAEAGMAEFLGGATVIVGMNEPRVIEAGLVQAISGADHGMNPLKETALDLMLPGRASIRSGGLLRTCLQGG
jgi:hypothetical protein